MAAQNIRIPVRVMAVERRQTKTGKTMYLQDVQIDQAEKRSVSQQRKYFDEDRVLSPGDYTAGATFYSVFTTDANGFKREHLCIALRDLQKA